MSLLWHSMCKHCAHQDHWAVIATLLALEEEVQTSHVVCFHEYDAVNAEQGYAKIALGGHGEDGCIGVTAYGSFFGRAGKVRPIYLHA